MGEKCVFATKIIIIKPESSKICVRTSWSSWTSCDCDFSPPQKRRVCSPAKSIPCLTNPEDHEICSEDECPFGSGHYDLIPDTDDESIIYDYFPGQRPFTTKKPNIPVDLFTTKSSFTTSKSTTSTSTTSTSTSTTSTSTTSTTTSTINSTSLTTTTMSTLTTSSTSSTSTSTTISTIKKSTTFTTSTTSKAYRVCTLDCGEGFCITGWRNSPDKCVCHRGFEYDKEAGTCVRKNQEISTTTEKTIASSATSSLTKTTSTTRITSTTTTIRTTTSPATTSEEIFDYGSSDRLYDSLYSDQDYNSDSNSTTTTTTATTLTTTTTTTSTTTTMTTTTTTATTTITSTTTTTTTTSTTTTTTTTTSTTTTTTSTTTTTTTTTSKTTTTITTTTTTMTMTTTTTTTITTYTDNALPEGSASSSDILTDDDSLGLDSDYSDSFLNLPRAAPAKTSLVVDRSLIPDETSFKPEYTNWTSWTGCSKTCGGGTQTRFRSCVKDCEFSPRKMTVRECNTEFCSGFFHIGRKIWEKSWG